MIQIRKRRTGGREEGGLKRSTWLSDATSSGGVRGGGGGAGMLKRNEKIKEGKEDLCRPDSSDAVRASDA